VHEQIDKNALKIRTVQAISQVDTSSIFVVEHQSFTKFSIR